MPSHLLSFTVLLTPPTPAPTSTPKPPPQDLAVFTVGSKWAPNKPLEAQKCYGTTSIEHPAVQMITMERGRYYMGTAGGTAVACMGMSGTMWVWWVVLRAVLRMWGERAASSLHGGCGMRAGGTCMGETRAHEDMSTARQSTMLLTCTRLPCVSGGGRSC